MTLAADHTITEGIWKGSTWSYDAAQQILTVNQMHEPAALHLVTHTTLFRSRCE